MKRFLYVLMSCVLVFGMTACNQEIEVNPENNGQVEGNTKPEEPDDETENKNSDEYEEEKANKDESKIRKNDVEKISIETGVELLTERDGNKVIAQGEYPVAVLSETDAEKYPMLDKALKALNEEWKNKGEEQFEELAGMARKYADTEKHDPEYETKRNVFVRRADADVVSLAMNPYWWDGGAHPHYYRSAVCVDPQNGKILTLDDVLNDKSIIPELLEKVYEEKFEEPRMANVEWDKLIEQGECVWTVDNNGITFFFNPYTLLNNPSQTPVITLTNNEFPELLKEKYIQKDTVYGVQMENDLPLYEDVNGDGTAEEINFSAVESTADRTGFIKIEINGNKIDERDYFYDFYASFVRINSKESMLYLELYKDGDYTETVCYGLGDEITQIGKVSGGMKRSMQGEEKTTVIRAALTNPDCFYMSVDTRLLSTVQGAAEYCVGDNLIPKMKDPMIVFDKESQLEFTLLQDLTVEIYDMNNRKVTGTKTISRNEKMLYYGADNEQYAYLKLSDGEIVRVKVDVEEDGWPVNVCGESVEKMFKGVIFAG